MISFHQRDGSTQELDKKTFSWRKLHESHPPKISASEVSGVQKGKIAFVLLIAYAGVFVSLADLTGDCFGSF